MSGKFGRSAFATIFAANFTCPIRRAYEITLQFRDVQPGQSFILTGVSLGITLPRL